MTDKGQQLPKTRLPSGGDRSRDQNSRGRDNRQQEMASDHTPSPPRPGSRAASAAGSDPCGGVLEGAAGTGDKYDPNIQTMTNYPEGAQNLKQTLTFEFIPLNRNSNFNIDSVGLPNKVEKQVIALPQGVSDSEDATAPSSDGDGCNIGHNKAQSTDGRGVPYVEKSQDTTPKTGKDVLASGAVGGYTRYHHQDPTTVCTVPNTISPIGIKDTSPDYTGSAFVTKQDKEMTIPDMTEKLLTPTDLTSDGDEKGDTGTAAPTHSPDDSTSKQADSVTAAEADLGQEDSASAADVTSGHTQPINKSTRSEEPQHAPQQSRISSYDTDTHDPQEMLDVPVTYTIKCAGGTITITMSEHVDSHSDGQSVTLTQTAPPLLQESGPATGTEGSFPESSHGTNSHPIKPPDSSQAFTERREPSPVPLEKVEEGAEPLFPDNASSQVSLDTASSGEESAESPDTALQSPSREVQQDLPLAEGMSPSHDGTAQPSALSGARQAHPPPECSVIRELQPCVVEPQQTPTPAQSFPTQDATFQLQDHPPAPPTPAGDEGDPPLVAPVSYPPQSSASEGDPPGPDGQGPPPAPGRPPCTPPQPHNTTQSPVLLIQEELRNANPHSGVGAHGQGDGHTQRGDQNRICSSVVLRYRNTRDTCSNNREEESYGDYTVDLLLGILYRNIHDLPHDSYSDHDLRRHDLPQEILRLSDFTDRFEVMMGRSPELRLPRNLRRFLDERLMLDLGRNLRLRARSQIQTGDAEGGDLTLCVLCRSRAANVFFLPCGHFMVCYTCMCPNLVFLCPLPQCCVRVEFFFRVGN